MSRLAHDEILALHRDLVATPSVSGSENAGTVSPSCKVVAGMP